MDNEVMKEELLKRITEMLDGLINLPFVSGPVEFWLIDKMVRRLRAGLGEMLGEERAERFFMFVDLWWRGCFDEAAELMWEGFGEEPLEVLLEQLREMLAEKFPY